MVGGGEGAGRRARETLGRLQRMAAFEGQDFDPQESGLSRAIARAAGPREHAREERLRWALSAAIGASMGVIAFAVNGLVEVLTRLRLGAALAAIERGAGGAGAFAAWVGLAGLLAAVAGGHDEARIVLALTDEPHERLHEHSRDLGEHEQVAPNDVVKATAHTLLSAHM